MCESCDCNGNRESVLSDCGLWYWKYFCPFIKLWVYKLQPGQRSLLEEIVVKQEQDMPPEEISRGKVIPFPVRAAVNQ